MKTHTSKQTIWLKSILILPLIAMTLYGFSETKEIVKQENRQSSKNEIIQDILIYIDKDNQLSLNQKSVKLENLRDEVNNLNPQLTDEQRKIFLSASIHYEDDESEDLIKKIHKALLQCNVYRTSVSNVIKMKNLGIAPALPNNKYIGKTIEEAEAIYETQTIDLSPRKSSNQNSPWKIEVGVNDITYTEIEDNPNTAATEDMVTEYNSIVKRINAKQPDDKVYKLKDINRMQLIYGQMTKEQKVNSEKLPNIYSSDFYQQQTATEEEIEAYNKLASQHNNKPEKLRIIKQKDFERMEYLYKKMSKEQQVNAEAFPNFPPPPPNPAPKSSLDHVIEIAKKGGTFYYENKSISSDEAISLLKQNKELNISTKGSDTKEPKVYISKDPIVIKQQTKTKEMVMLNGKKTSDGSFVLSLEDLSNVKLTIESGTISNFKFKIPGKPTVSIEGNMLNNEAKSLLKELSSGDAVQFFIIKNSENAVHPPVLIQIR